MNRTWPEDWEARKRGDGCPFCREQEQEPFYRGRVSNGYLEPKAVSLGHSILILRGRHVANFTGLTPSEVGDLWGDVQEVGKIVQLAFEPCHMNYELLGNGVPHIHVHVLPRYLDDAAPGRPLPWEKTKVGDAEFSEQHRMLRELADGLSDEKT